jgi:hypothetical protein
MRLCDTQFCPVPLLQLPYGRRSSRLVSVCAPTLAARNRVWSGRILPKFHLYGRRVSQARNQSAQRQKKQLSSLFTSCWLLRWHILRPVLRNVGKLVPGDTGSHLRRHFSSNSHVHVLAGHKCSRGNKNRNESSAHATVAYTPMGL